MHGIRPEKWSTSSLPNRNGDNSNLGDAERAQNTHSRVSLEKL